MLFDPDQLIPTPLGPCTIPSPAPQGAARFVDDSARLSVVHDLGPDVGRATLEFQLAGPRQQIFFRPESVRAAIVTCGGLCPGLNNVIRSIYVQLRHIYGVREILGIRYGYHGFRPDCASPPIRLEEERISRIHQLGGTILGSSRGPVDAAIIVDFLERENIRVLFTVGGDGTQRGAQTIVEEVARRNLKIAVVGVPKTIDNDIQFVSRSFGYFTAVEKAKEVIDCAHVEAKGALHGISIVKLMGRESGFIATGATLASQEVNFCLIPEVPFQLEGPTGFLAVLERRMRSRHHAVIVVAEGAGQHLFSTSNIERDASGNIRHHDIGVLLRDVIVEHFRRISYPVNVRYFDPSYYIRSVPASSVDSVLCDRFARNAVHAAMAGKTGVVVGHHADQFILVPMPVATYARKRVSESSEEWANVLMATGQPPRME